MAVSLLMKIKRPKFGEYIDFKRQLNEKRKEREKVEMM